MFGERTDKAIEIKNNMLNIFKYYFYLSEYARHYIIMSFTNDGVSLNYYLTKMAARSDLRKEDLLTDLFVSIINMQTSAEWFLQYDGYTDRLTLIRAIINDLTHEQMSKYIMTVL